MLILIVTGTVLRRLTRHMNKVGHLSVLFGFMLGSAVNPNLDFGGPITRKVDDALPSIS